MTILAQSQTSGLHWVDFIVLGVYACSMVGLGWYYGRRQSSTSEYFVGSGRMNPGLIGISLFATLLSTISYLGTPGEIISKGPTVTFAGFFTAPLAFALVGYVLIPALMRKSVTSAYELLETRLGLAVRVQGAIFFVVLRLVWMSLLIHLAAKALLATLGWGPERLFLVTALTGVVAVVYTALGGLRAVVFTDFVQFLLLLGGAALVIATVTLRLGSLDWVPTKWAANWDDQPLFSLDPHARTSLVGLVISQTTWYVCTAGADQTAVQRYMATGGAKRARAAYLVTMLANLLVTILLTLVGFALLGYFQTYSHELPPGMSLREGDLLFPHYIAHQLPPGLAGLIVAAMFAAAMSSVDSGVNSITAVVTTDFVDRFSRRQLTPHGHVLLAKVLAFSIGAIVVAASSAMEHVPGNFLEMSKRTSTLLMAPLFSLFFMALFVPFATQFGTIVGAICGLFASVLIAFWEPITGLQAISFMWIGISSLVVSLGVGVGLSSLQRHRDR